MFWVLWFSLVLIFIFSIVGVFAWNGNLLELIKIKTAKKLWLLSVVGITLGLLLFIWSVATIMNTPSMILKFLTLPSASPPLWLWCAISLLLIGGFIVGIPTQLYQLKLTKISRDMRKNLFYVGMFLLVVSVLLLIWLFIPGNQLPA